MRHSFLNKTTVGLISILILLVFSLTGCNAHQAKHTPASQQRFDDIEFWVKLFENPERDKWQKPDEVVKNLNLKDGDVVADIGAGTGYFTRHLARAVGPTGKALGLDISSSMVGYMKEDARKLNLKNYEARVVKADDPELELRSVDVIFLCNTYHHIEDRTNYFKRVVKSLKADGRIVIVDFYIDSPVGPKAPGHKVSKEIALKEMKNAGYRLIKSHDILPYQYFLEFELKTDGSPPIPDTEMMKQIMSMFKNLNKKQTLDYPPIPKTEGEKKILNVLGDIIKTRWKFANVPIEDGRLLRILTEAVGAKNVVEIGTSNGYSAIWLCLALRSTGGKLTTFEIDPHRAALARQNFKKAGVEDLVTIVVGDAHKEIMKLKESIDILFIDADKPGYLDYLNKLLPLLRPGGLIMAHNMNFPSPDPEYIKAITTRPDLETIFLHMNGPGMGVTLKKH